MNALLTGLAVGILLAQDLIDLELTAPIGAWQLNVPLADLLALLLLLLALPRLLRERIPWPGAVGAGLLLLACLLSLHGAIAPAEGLHTLVRKPLFCYLAYGVGLAWVVARALPSTALRAGLLGWVGLTAGLSIATSVARIASGDALWFAVIMHITPNHKTLAVALAAGLPLLRAPALGEGRLSRFFIGLALVAIALSASKTAWLATLVGAGLYWPRARPLCWRPALVLPLLAIGLALAYYAPLIVDSRAMLDAARSRHSLDLRAWQMFAAHPLVGSGIGMNVLIEQVTFPHYRVNGVDAHGLIQKVGSETGALGLTGYLLFLGAVLRDLRLRWTGGLGAPAYTALATVITLHFTLLFSTETWSMTQWIPFAVAWGIAHREAGR